jgi:hypothetical protein
MMKDDDDDDELLEQRCGVLSTEQWQNKVGIGRMRTKRARALYIGNPQHQGLQSAILYEGKARKVQRKCDVKA